MIVLAMFALVGFKIGPPYFEYLTIKKHFQAIVNDPGTRDGQRREVETAFSRRSQIDEVKSISGKDLQITKQGDQMVISAEYSVCVPFVANIRACMDFQPTSGK